MGLVENNVGGLIESSQGAPQEEEESHAEEGAGVCDELSGSLLLSQKKKEWKLAYHDVAPVVGDDGDDLCSTPEWGPSSGLGLRERDSRSTSDSSAGPPAIAILNRGEKGRIPPELRRPSPSVVGAKAKP
jgi:hypothetical protein